MFWMRKQQRERGLGPWLALGRSFELAFVRFVHRCACKHLNHDWRLLICRYLKSHFELTILKLNENWSVWQKHFLLPFSFRASDCLTWLPVLRSSYWLVHLPSFSHHAINSTLGTMLFPACTVRHTSVLRHSIFHKVGFLYSAYWKQYDTSTREEHELWLFIN